MTLDGGRLGPSEAWSLEPENSGTGGGASGWEGPRSLENPAVCGFREPVVPFGLQVSFLRQRACFGFGGVSARADARRSAHEPLRRMTR